MQLKDDFVAQLVEQLTLNQWVVSSSLTEVTGRKSRGYDVDRNLLFFTPCTRLVKRKS